MACTIDHLSAHQRIRVLRDFRDACRTVHRAGETGVIRFMDLLWDTQELFIDWERDGRRERLVFSLDATDGPRTGKMKEYFEVMAAEEPPVSAPSKRRSDAVAIHRPPAAEPVTDRALYGEAIVRVGALAVRRRFSDAEEQIRLILVEPDPYGGVLQQLAEDLGAIALASREGVDPSVYEWLRERTMNLWYAWGSQATSGGEGADRSVQIRAAEQRLPLPGHFSSQK